ncbi:A/G-specific adenine glycosylase [Sphingomonas sp. HT-1]|uniref:A/G-specific adenine glycosylase n=1 Tax=unclassified Sphingomonas TaxID=196159 RepID=UPI000306B880|nr:MULTISPECIES: A/G-specific adenine glycosylase [unclassified Sphingomonas]KTF70311.1 A/G-specific adenine glycosylase [Sphingomonas sp. WG]
MPDNVPESIAPALLAWYDAHARRLPWRAPPGANVTDPYRVWLSEVMLQQTQVATVIPYFETFTARWPSFEALAAAEDADLMAAWAGLGYYARARNLLACAREVARLGDLPDTEAGLRSLPGIGDYTAAAIAAIAFGRRAVVVDANVERVVTRLFALAEPLPGSRPAIRRLTDTITPDARAGDFAQAMMDLGSGICTVRAPKCLVCPIAFGCTARAAGNPETYPVKAKKAPKPQRHGTMFWLEREGQVLIVRRPDKGLLGGMRALPTGPWVESPPGLVDAPLPADWRMVGETVRHGFTHFELEVALATATISRHAVAPPGEWWPIGDIESAGLPTVFAKAAKAIRRLR